MKTFVSAALLALAALTQTASACEELVSINRVQTVDLMNVIRNAEADPLDQYFAFETLMCSDQSGIRDLTLRTAAKSANETIQGQVVMLAVMEKEAIGVRLLETEGLSKEQYERIKQRPIENMSVRFRDFAKGCLSFSSKDSCNPDNVLTVNGTHVMMRTRHNGQGIDGDFRLKDGALEGIFTYTFEKLTYPARIELF